ncbi:MAG TPA: hypothetical protein VNP96_02045 [Solirubrobacterales bacterium]|nr:hypothetical protein [Solirubrobacterales bacterium]
MTLVLNLISESWAIQVSDRRLVWLGRDNKIVRKDDERNKAVMWCNRLAFAYTGLAELGPMREATDEWLARELAEWWTESPGEEGQDAVIAAVMNRAAAAMKRPRIARGIPAHLRRHAFVGIGWARFDGQGGMVPYIVQVHNFPAEAGEDAAAKEEFGYAIQHLPEGEKSIFVSWVGQELHAAEKAMLEDLNRGDPRSKEYGPYAAEVLVGIVRAVAARNEFVGRGLLINALPKWAIHPGSTETLLLAGGPMWENLSFLHLPSDDDDPVVRGPRYVCEGRQMSNFQAWVPSEDEIQKMQEGAPPTWPSE